MEEFSIKTKQKDNISILGLEGYLDAHTSVELEKCFEKIISEKKFKIIVNFEKLSYISSAGLGVFMAFIETARNNAGDIKLCAMSDKIYNIFDMLGFPILFEIYKEEDAAIEKFN
ncbi:MAG TPA: STAS domain-containing protein [Ignavibacteria bacterium]|nr:STAS domain-containing protein [Ignavibacteria bacterium]